MLEKPCEKCAMFDGCCKVGFWYVSNNDSGGDVSVNSSSLALMSKSIYYQTEGMRRLV